MTEVLAVEDLAVNFGGVAAVDGVSFSVPAGAIVGIIGPNGAGKTTVFDALCGFVEASGQVQLSGNDITKLSPTARALKGMGRSFQDGRLFPSLTVRETLAVALERHFSKVGPVLAALRLGRAARVERGVRDRVDELIHLMGLKAFRNKFIGELSTGTRRIVDLAATLAHRPAVLLLDEPSSGIAQRETEVLTAILPKIRQEIGCTMLIIEHDMPLVTSVSDELIAMETGRLIARGTPAEVVNDPLVVEAYLGVDAAVIRRSGALESKPICGARTASGRQCRRKPVPGAKRCALHKGKR